MPHHLLLIEDDETAAYVTQRRLIHCGFTMDLHVVSDGKEALDYLACAGRYTGRQTGNPALIVLDLKLPDVDGFEVLKYIRSAPALFDIPVFILSASRTEEDIYRSTLLGISKYLVKPLAMSEFTPAVDKVLNPGAGDATESPRR
ncbi:response regulator [Noviherbaspirillum pedocola]|uniref:Response regulator n=1 Tax=Noviherbaspirillum pedocola TaxID=2801341 RepID=A0A934W7Q2_9BURK|nr:response regulator [Noviherbaspirillum pedocola]MBK4735868.1 response regulator [Noviherbaspirillum pedocola]